MNEGVVAGSRMIPRTVRPYLSTTGAAHGPADAVGIDSQLVGLRHEALDVLADGYRSSTRTVLALLAWLAVTGGALLLAVGLGQRATWPTLGVGAAIGGGTIAMVVGAWLGWSVHRAGRTLTRAAAAWLRVPAPTGAGDDARPLRRIVRHRALLGGGLAVVAVALAALVGVLLAQRSTAGTPGNVLSGSLLLAEVGITGAAGLLGLAALTTAGAAAGVLGGVARLLDAAWQRPTVVPAEMPAPPAAFWAPAAGTSPAPATVEIDVRALGAIMAAGRPDGEPSAPPAASGTRIEVVLPDGGLLPGGVTLIGRQPVRRPEDLDVTGVVLLTEGTVTKTHAALHLAEGELWVVDRASTNGTLVEDARGTLVRARPWHATPVPVPATIHLGRARLRVRSVALPAPPGSRPYEVAS